LTKIGYYQTKTYGKEFLIYEDPKGRIMNTASVVTPSQKMSVGKPGLSLVRDAKPKLLDQLRKRCVLVITVAELNRLIAVG